MNKRTLLPGIALTALGLLLLARPGPPPPDLLGFDLLQLWRVLRYAPLALGFLIVLREVMRQYECNGGRLPVLGRPGLAGVGIVVVGLGTMAGCLYLMDLMPIPGKAGPEGISLAQMTERAKGWLLLLFIVGAGVLYAWYSGHIEKRFADNAIAALGAVFRILRVIFLALILSLTVVATVKKALLSNEFTKDIVISFQSFPANIVAYATLIFVFAFCIGLAHAILSGSKSEKGYIDIPDVDFYDDCSDQNNVVESESEIEKSSSIISDDHLESESSSLQEPHNIEGTRQTLAKNHYRKLAQAFKPAKSTKSTALEQQTERSSATKPSFINKVLEHGESPNPLGDFANKIIEDYDKDPLDSKNLGKAALLGLIIVAIVMLCTLGMAAYAYYSYSKGFFPS